MELLNVPPWSRKWQHQLSYAVYIIRNAIVYVILGGSKFKFSGCDRRYRVTNVLLITLQIIFRAYRISAFHTSFFLFLFEGNFIKKLNSSNSQQMSCRKVKIIWWDYSTHHLFSFQCIIHYSDVKIFIVLAFRSCLDFDSRENISKI